RGCLAPSRRRAYHHRHLLQQIEEPEGEGHIRIDQKAKTDARRVHLVEQRPGSIPGEVEWRVPDKVMDAVNRVAWQRRVQELKGVERVKKTRDSEAQPEQRIAIERRTLARHFHGNSNHGKGQTLVVGEAPS